MELKLDDGLAQLARTKWSCLQHVIYTKHYKIFLDKNYTSLYNLKGSTWAINSADRVSP